MRKTEIIRLTDDGEERTFRITQMPATKAERWCNRAAFLLIGAGKNVKTDNINLDEIMKLIGSLDYEKVEPLYNELIECCSFVSGNTEIQCTQDTIDAQITDPMNLYKLRVAALKLNFSFFTNALRSQGLNKDTITFKKNTQQ